MKGYKFLAPVALVALMLLSFYMLVDMRMATEQEYQQYLDDARYYASMGIQVDAVQNYNKALAMKKDLAVSLEVGQFYVEMEDVTGGIAWGERMVADFAKEVQAYEYLLTRYHEVNDYNRCYALHDTITKRGLSSDGISKIMHDIQYVFYFGEAYDNVDVYSKGYCAVQYEDKWGLAKETGENSAPCVFKKVGPLFDGLAPVLDKEEEAYFIDAEGNKKFVPQIDGEIIELSSMVDGVYAVNNGKTWSFYNQKNEKISDEYEEVSLFANTVVAVKKEGQWVVLNDKFQPICEQKYEEVAQDDRGIIYRNNVIFVYQDGYYSMINNEGTSISDKRFEDVKVFTDHTYAAVKDEKGWTFINNTGEVVFEDAYFEDAHSFINGFAAVKKNGLWGYINLDGDMAIDFQFVNVRDFNPRGCAFVEIEDTWHLLRLYSNNYEK